jgi:hypothetical protein
MTDEELRAQFEALNAKIDALDRKVDALPDIRLLGRQVQHVLQDVAAIKDEMLVHTAMLRKFDGAQSVPIAEVQRVYQHVARLDDRVRTLEDAQPL